MTGIEPDSPPPPPSPTFAIAEPPAIVQVPPLPSRAGGRLPGRAIRLPARFRDEPPAPLSADPDPAAPVPQAPERLLPRVRLIVTNPFRTLSNVFNVWRDYLYKPSYDPESLIAPEDLANISAINTSDIPEMIPAPDVIPTPHTNETISMIMEWKNNGHTVKSDEEIMKLVHDVIRHPDFKVEDLEKFSVRKENTLLDQAEVGDTSASLFENENFTESSVKVDVPSGRPNVPPQTFEIPGLQHRSLVSIIKSAFTSPLASKFHLSPFKLFHRSPLTGETERAYSELYNSDAFIDEHHHIQQHAPVDVEGCKAEKVIAAMMIWSDSTHLANFGTASLWPIYLQFGNLSKYIRASPNSGSCFHLAYIPSVSALISSLTTA
jgi:hypothetical protein